MNGGYYYELTADIDLSGLEWQGNDFYGAFDGKGYSIKNMSYVGTVKNADVYLGLFGKSCGVIKNVNVEEATIVVEVTADDGAEHSAYVGGIVACRDGILHIHNSTVDEYSIFTVKNVKNSVGSIYIGGIVGLASSSSTITNCTNSGSVSATGASGYGTYAGGIAGIADIITNCTNSGDVSSSYRAGGIVGYAYSSTITNCYSLVAGDGNNGETCTVEQLNSKEFYTETLGWSEDVWDFSELDIENGKYPKLK